MTSAFSWQNSISLSLLHSIFQGQICLLLQVFLDFLLLHSSPLLPSSEATAERSYPMSKERRLHKCLRAERSYSTFKVRRGSHEEIPLVQGKEQRLRFTGAAMKRYPSSKVRETQVRW